MTLGSCAALYNGIESFCQHLRDEFVTTEKDGLKLTTGMQKSMCLQTNATEKRRRLLIMKERTLDTLEQGSPNFFFNGPDDNVDLWSRARFERNIIERLCNFTDLNIERI